MKWVRANIGLGARVALFALAVQFALSFGHFHPIAAQAAPNKKANTTICRTSPRAMASITLAGKVCSSVPENVGLT